MSTKLFMWVTWRQGQGEGVNVEEEIGSAHNKKKKKKMVSKLRPHFCETQARSKGLFWQSGTSEDLYFVF